MLGVSKVRLGNNEIFWSGNNRIVHIETIIRTEGINRRCSTEGATCTFEWT